VNVSGTATPPGREARRRRIGLLGAACAALLVLGWWASADGLTYYLTPSEAKAGGYPDGTLRVGGLVVSGSLQEADERSTLLLTDGASDIVVSYPGRMPAVVVEGQGAVAEGTFDDAGVLHAERLLMRHSNEYRAPEGPAP